MAKKRKTSQKEETPGAVEAEILTPEEASEDVTETPDVVVEQASEETPVEPEVVAEIEPEPMVEEPIQEPEPEIKRNRFEPLQTTPEPHDTASNGVLLPALLGGLIAAGIGFAAAYYFIPRFEPEMVETMNANESAIAELRDQVASIDVAAEIAPLTEDVGVISAQMIDQFASFEDRIVSFENRLATLEKQPSGDGTLQEAALLAYQAELDNLRSQVEEQAGAAFAQLESTREEAAAIEAAALLAARNAKARAALSQIRSALETGAPMSNALSELEEVMGEPAPVGLASVVEGVPTLSKLQGDFPPAARQSLADSRSEGASGESTGAFGSFLREQLNVRSVAPREGDDADAILSRAEAALKEGQLETALTEVSGLPEIAAAPLAGWVNQAQARVDALNAANEISTSLNDN